MCTVCHSVSVAVLFNSHSHSQLMFCRTHGDPLVPAAPRSWCPPLSCCCCVRGALWGNWKTKTSILTLPHDLRIPVEQQQLALVKGSTFSALKSLGAERILWCFLNIKAARSCEKYWRIINKRIHIRSHSEWLPFLKCINGNLLWQLSCCFPSSWTQTEHLIIIKKFNELLWLFLLWF